MDVEEYFQVSAFDSIVPRDAWERLESRVARSLTQLLELLACNDVRATFFVLGWLADRHPKIVRDIVAAGHEVASHGWDHRRVTDQTREEFRCSVRNTRRELEDLSGTEVRGFRAPSFSIVRGREWALDVLIEEGYRYDSSLLPVRFPRCGYPGGQRDPHWLERPTGRLAEFPPAVLRRWGIALPAGGGAYFRVLPYALTRTALRDCERRGVSGTFYVHPWELDPEQPRTTAPLLTRLRHYTGLVRVAGRLARLLREFRFKPMGEAIATLVRTES